MKETFAIIDIGSNTIRMDVYEIQNAQYSLLLSTKAVAGLAGMVENGKLIEKGVDTLCQVLSDLKKILDRLHCDHYAAVATASLRLLEDPASVIETVMHRTGIAIVLLNGSQEAGLSFSGARSGLAHTHGLYIDTGGGSTELVLFDENRIDAACSLPAGSLNLYRDFVSGLMPDRSEVEAMDAHLETLFDEYARAFKGIDAEAICITGGSMRAIRDVLEAIGWIEKGQLVFPAVLLERLLEHLMSDQAATSKVFVRVRAERIHTMLPALVICCFLVRKFHVQEAEISLLGLRAGAVQAHIAASSR